MIDYKCPVCGNTMYSSAPLLKVKCNSCGCEYAPNAQSEPTQTPPQFNRGVFDNGPSGKSRGVAGLLAILLGYFGIHYFYVGKNTAGIIFLLITLLSCGFFGAVVAILSLISGVLMLTSTEEEFEEKYVYSNSTMPI